MRARISTKIVAAMSYLQPGHGPPPVTGVKRYDDQQTADSDTEYDKPWSQARHIAHHRHSTDIDKMKYHVEIGKISRPTQSVRKPENWRHEKHQQQQIRHNLWHVAESCAQNAKQQSDPHAVDDVKNESGNQKQRRQIQFDTENYHNRDIDNRIMQKQDQIPGDDAVSMNGQWQIDRFNDVAARGKALTTFIYEAR